MTGIRRRTLVLSAPLLALAGIAGCRSVLPQIEGGAASAQARGHIEAIRGQAQLGMLAPDASLERAAREQAGYMAVAGRMDHTALRGRDFVTRMKAGGIPAPAAENLAHGRMEIDRLFAMWMASDGHRRNMLDARFSRYGLAYASDGSGARYWALVLG